MYLNFEVDIPKIPGKINYVKKGRTVYVRYVLERVYHPEKKYNVPEQRIIGKRSENNPDRMLPNETYVKCILAVRRCRNRKPDRREAVVCV